MKLRHIAPVALILALAACRPGEPVYNVAGASYGGVGYGAGQAVSLQDYERAIIRAGTKRKWNFQRLGPGHLEASTLVRGKHRATVDITFNTETFSITRKSTQNLEYDPSQGIIHPNYNSWISLLESDIKAEIQRLKTA